MSDSLQSLFSRCDSVLVFDTETSGLSWQRDEIIEFSAIRLTASGTEEVDEFVRCTRSLPPRIVERFQWERIPLPPARRALYGRLYGGDSGSFCVLLPPLPGFPEPGRLERLIRLYSPIGTPHRLVFLNPCSRADDHCYLDGTGVLATPGEAAANAGTLDGFIALG